MKVLHIGLCDYCSLWRVMQRFAAEATPDTAECLWVVEHPPVYTLGVSASEEDFLHSLPIPRVRVDRGGKVTYHAPGQKVFYPLINLKRRGVAVPQLVFALEEAVMVWLQQQGIIAFRKTGAPGVYVADGKIAALGLRVRQNGWCYHGLSVNIALDLTPFAAIRPCGVVQPVTEWRALGSLWSQAHAEARLLAQVYEKIKNLGS